MLFSFSGLAFVILLIGSLLVKGHRSFYQSYIEVSLSQQTIEIFRSEGPSEQLFERIELDIQESLRLSLNLEEAFPAAQTLARALLTDRANFYVYEWLITDFNYYRQQPIWVPTSSSVDQLLKDDEEAFAEYGLTLGQFEQIKTLQESGRLTQRFSDFLFLNNSRLPELAGIYGALVGSIYTLLVTLIIAIPMGIASAIYLQEFSNRGSLVQWVEVSINNLAAVPSIIFGLFGLGVLIEFIGMPRSVPLVAGIVLALMTFPTIVIASRQALVAVPISLREAALALGASKHQMIFHHVVPFAMPSMMTGAIIGMAQALGETAPLLMLGMVAFIASEPTGIFDPATTLPVQIFLWADSPERHMVERTIGAILVLMALLICMNLTTVFIRHYFERKFK